MDPRRVALLMDLPPQDAYHARTLRALELASAAAGSAVEVAWIRTAELARRWPDARPGLGGVFVGPGSPYDDPEAVLAAIADARTSGLPLVGT